MIGITAIISGELPEGVFPSCKVERVSRRSYSARRHGIGDLAALFDASLRTGPHATAAPVLADAVLLTLLSYMGIHATHKGLVPSQALDLTHGGIRRRVRIRV
jgi:hypothetical protein